MIIGKQMAGTNGQDFPGGLWMVATPIGNLQDVSPRARGALDAASWVLCEDTRQAQKLLRALGIDKAPSRIVRLDAHASRSSLEKWAERVIEGGEPIAYVSDAGTPGISDPGAALAERVRASGGAVWPVPGPSAVAAFISASGLAVGDGGFWFRGFFPRKAGEVDRELARWTAGGPDCVIYFESPQRIGSSLERLAKWRPESKVAVCKELTKLYERWFWGELQEVAPLVAKHLSEEGPLGEWVIGLQLSSRESNPPEGHGGDEAEKPHWELTLESLIRCGVSPSQAVKEVCQSFGVAKRLVYEASLKKSGKKS